jgi:hypothetical protein
MERESYKRVDCVSQMHHTGNIDLRDVVNPGSVDNVGVMRPNTLGTAVLGGQKRDPPSVDSVRVARTHYIHDGASPGTPPL